MLEQAWVLALACVAATLLVVSHSLSKAISAGDFLRGSKDRDAVSSPPPILAVSFTVWRFVFIGIISAVVLGVAALVLWQFTAHDAPSSDGRSLSSSSYSGRQQVWHSIVSCVGSFRNVGVIIAASMLMLIATSVQISGFTRYGVAAMNIPIAIFTVVASAVIGCAVFGERLGATRSLAVAILVAGLALFAFGGDS